MSTLEINGRVGAKTSLRGIVTATAPTSGGSDLLVVHVTRTSSTSGTADVPFEDVFAAVETGKPVALEVANSSGYIMRSSNVQYITDPEYVPTLIFNNFVRAFLIGHYTELNVTYTADSLIIAERNTVPLQSNQGSENAGKYLGIDSSGYVVPVSAPGGSGTFFVSFELDEDDNVIADKTFTDITTAIDAGQNIIGRFTDSTGVYNLALKGFNSRAMMFGMEELDPNVREIIYMYVNMFSDGRILYADGFLPLTPTEIYNGEVE